MPYGPGFHLGAYAPGTGRWACLPDGGLEGDGDPDLVWTGRALVVINTYTSLADYDSGTRPNTTETSFDVGTRRWTHLPALPTGVTDQEGPATWTGASVVLWDGGPSLFADTPPNGAWVTVTGGARPGLDRPATVWTGSAVLVWGGLTSNLDGPGPATEVAGAASWVPAGP